MMTDCLNRSAPDRRVRAADPALFCAWAEALHISQAALIEVVNTVGDDAKDVIPYVLRGGGRSGASVSASRRSAR
jgi:hypothetical protein